MCRLFSALKYLAISHCTHRNGSDSSVVCNGNTGNKVIQKHEWDAHRPVPPDWGFSEEDVLSTRPS